MRLRIVFSKTGALRYTGHLDMQTTWERTIRRAGLPLAYTQGFHPGPKIQIASALPLGFIGRAEIVDIWLREDTGSSLSGSYRDAIQAAAPPGLTVTSAEKVDENSAALQTQVASAEYEVTLLDPVDKTELAMNIAKTLEAESLPRERRGKAYNLRPLLEELTIMPATSDAPLLPSEKPLEAFRNVQVEPQDKMIFMRLAAREGATARPEEVLAVLGIPFDSVRIERSCIILKDGMK